MTTTLVSGPRTLSLSRDNDGHRNYAISHIVQDDRVGGVAGPLTILTTPGLPQIGDPWLVLTDADIWAFCTPEASVTVHEEREGDPPSAWKVTQKFSTNPRKRCQDINVEDPLLEPPKVSGSFVRYSRQVSRDRFDVATLNSSYEQLQGPQVEFDFSNMSVRIEFNVADLELDLVASQVNKVNDAVLWGMDARTIKLSNAPWERKYFGICDVYYTRILEFEINADTWDRDVMDEGSKVVRGAWKAPGQAPWNNEEWVYVADSNANPLNPKDYDQYVDSRGNPGRTLLDGAGMPVDGTNIGVDTGTGTPVTAPAKIHIEYYGEADFLLLGIPTVL